MAERRMLSKKIFQSRKFLMMPFEAQALYTHLILSSDDDGVVEAFPIVRMIGAKEDSLGLLVVKKFILPLNDDMVYFITDFEEQNKIRADRVQPSRYRELLLEKTGLVVEGKRVTSQKKYIDGQVTDKCLTDDGQVTDKCPHSIGKDSIGKDSIVESRSANDDEKNLIFKKLKEAFGEMSVNGTMVEEVERLLQQYGQELVVLALDKTILNAGKSLRYTMSILQRWDSQGLRTAEQIRVADEEYERKKSNKTQVDPYGNIPSWSNLRPENQKEPEPEMSDEEYERRLKEFLASE
ncbi:DnaD domain-containing protein [Streptococcus rubneri]|uniref:DnaD domain-containing protein n=1 Tax=Streptococcus rubneri TaxID=1234680 RepID=UPI00321978D6